MASIAATAREFAEIQARSLKTPRRCDRRRLRLRRLLREALQRVQVRSGRHHPMARLLVHPVAELMGRVEPEEVAAWEEPMAVLAEHHRRAPC